MGDRASLERAARGVYGVFRHPAELRTAAVWVTDDDSYAFVRASPE